MPIAQCLINGVPADTISVADRGLQYGDGCFETIRVHRQSPVFLGAHLTRLAAACDSLRVPFDPAVAEQEIRQMAQQSDSDAVIKLTVTRGPGGRGYTPDQTVYPTRIVRNFALDPAQLSHRENGITVQICTHPLSEQRALAGMKHLNRLDQVLASRELEEGVFEGLCLDQSGRVVEGTRSNLFLVIDGELLTPDLSRAGVHGIMRQYLLDRFRKAGDTVREEEFGVDELSRAGECFLCNSVFGVWPVIKLNGHATVTEWPIGAFTRRAMTYQDDAFSSAQ